MSTAEPEYLTEDDDFVSALENPQAVADAVAALTSAGTPPEIEPPRDGPVTLPGGLSNFGDVTRDAVVRELTGADEEEIVRTAGRGTLTQVVEAILKAGVERIGKDAPTASDLKALYVGDRDFLLMEISAATYGENVDFDEYDCPNCGRKVSFAVRIHEDIPITTLKDSDERQFEVKLRGGRTAVVRYPTGEDQDVIKPEMNMSEATSAVLDQIIVSIDGTPIEPGAGRSLGIGDRRKIQDEVAKRAPGPRYNEISFRHEDCDTDVTVPFGLMSLFPGLI
jgi:hypothetical protein